MPKSKKRRKKIAFYFEQIDRPGRTILKNRLEAEERSRLAADSCRPLDGLPLANSSVEGPSLDDERRRLYQIINEKEQIINEQEQIINEKQREYAMLKLIFSILNEKKSFTEKTSFTERASFVERSRFVERARKASPRFF
ncbi:MAG: hypothetical protein LBF22_06005 [Deltaproteobacteria bacterium]|nr:hypothetical protein [Deltaproteobacteria bacterium]